MNRFATRAESGVAPPVWAARHRALLWILGAQGAVLLVWMLAVGTDLVHAAGHVTLIAGSAAIALIPSSHRVRASAMAIGLFSQSILAVHLSGGATAVHFHFFVMLCVLALYEDVVAFSVGAAYVVLHHGVFGSLVPHEVFGDDAEQLHPWLWALIHGGFVLAAAAALTGNWRANRSLRASDAANHRRAEAYLEIADVLMVALDTSGRIQMANRMVCETLGRSQDELLGEPFPELAAPAASGAAGDVVTRVIGADGRPRLIEWHTAVTRDEAGNPIGTLSSGLDITVRKAAEDSVARQQQDVAELRRLAQAVASHDDARNAVVAIVAELCGATFAGLAESTEGGAELVITAANAPGVVGHRIQVGREPSSMASSFAAGAPRFVGDATGRPDLNERLLALSGGTSFLFQPVHLDGAPVAVLVVGWAEPVERLAARTAELVALAADEASVALQRLKAMRHLEQAALVDVLTGVPNRRAFDTELSKAIARAQRSGAPLSLAMLDLNGFKAVNDRYGHDAGDRLLKASAAAWEAELRQGDMIARLGGDEFAVLLPDCGYEDAPMLAARLRSATPHERGCGVGFAVWDGSEDVDALLRRADRALYADKARPALDELARTARSLLGEPVGVNPREWREDDLRLLEQLAERAATELRRPPAS